MFPLTILFVNMFPLIIFCKHIMLMQIINTSAFTILHTCLVVLQGFLADEKVAIHDVLQVKKLLFSSINSMILANLS